MYTLKKPLFLINESPLHAGTGDGLGIIDSPIQRERHTAYPKIEASSLKGAIREVYEKAHPQKGPSLDLVFGPDNLGNDAHQGALGFLDARILLFPIKSVKGVFAWVTCPAVLERFERDMQLVLPMFSLELPNNPDPGANTCWASSTCPQEITAGNDAYVILEEYSFEISERDPVKVKQGDKDPGKNLGTWLAGQGLVKTNSFWAKQLEHGIIVLNNTDFADFVSMSTEVITRTRIDNDTGTVANGALFNEEYLPAESIMYSIVMAAPVFKKKDELLNAPLKTAKDVMDFFNDGSLDVFQVGANATLGKGIMRSKILDL
ncbi:MAG: type III-B CRISPR module RAMP protein Cmr4 [Bacteroidota bacterium]